MLVLDNVDNATFLLETEHDLTTPKSDSQRLWGYLPYNQNGSILITSRHKPEVQKLVDDREIVSVEPMQVSDAISLLQIKLGEEPEADIAELAANLEYMPLAIVLAATYISRKRPLQSVKTYLQSFTKSDKKKANLLKHEVGQLRRDREAQNSIMLSWQISFDHIRQIQPSAADLLSLACFFDRQSIAVSLLRRRSEIPQRSEANGQQEPKEEETESDSEQSDDLDENEQFEADIFMLRDYALVAFTEDHTLRMHRLVQLATQEWLKAHKRHEEWKEEFIEKLHTIAPDGEYENWPIWRQLYPHTKLALQQPPKTRISLLQWAGIMHCTAWYAYRLHNASEAESIICRALETREKLLGRSNIKTASSVALLASIYSNQGRWGEAEKLQVEVLELLKTALGAKHPHTLTSMANLATTYRNQGRWNEAEKLQVEVLELRKTAPGAKHPNTLTSMANLA
jgi:hypothetical protein